MAKMAVENRMVEAAGMAKLVVEGSKWQNDS